MLRKHAIFSGAFSLGAISVFTRNKRTWFYSGADVGCTCGGEHSFEVDDSEDSWPYSPLEFEEPEPEQAAVAADGEGEGPSHKEKVTETDGDGEGEGDRPHTEKVTEEVPGLFMPADEELVNPWIDQGDPFCSFRGAKEKVTETDGDGEGEGDRPHTEKVTEEVPGLFMPADEELVNPWIDQGDPFCSFRPITDLGVDKYMYIFADTERVADCSTVATPVCATASSPSAIGPHQADPLPRVGPPPVPPLANFLAIENSLGRKCKARPQQPPYPPPFHLIAASQ